jgi:hypothetical protein
VHPTILLSKTNSYEILQRKKVYLSPYPKRLLSIASGDTPVGSAGHAPNEISFPRKVKKAKENLCSEITTIGREFILVKVGQPEDFHN